MRGILQWGKKRIPAQFKRGPFLRIARVILTPVNNLRILLWTYGQLRSALSGVSVDRKGSALPWISYPAIDYLSQLDLSNKDVFEFGAGNSTLYWAERTKRVVSVERDGGWYKKLITKLPANVSLIHATQDQEFVNTLGKQKQKFDIILVDNILRYECVVEAAQHLNIGGMIILDNSEGYVRSARYLREKGLMQVDMIGFAPAVYSLQATSLFFERNAEFATTDDVQPKWREGMTVFPKDWSPEQ